VWRHGSAKIADPDLADREWAANTDLSRASDAVKARAASEPTTLLEPQAHGGALKRTIAPAVDGATADSIAASSAQEKHWRAKLTELKYKQASGELVNAQEVQTQLVDVFTTCRTKLLGIPSKAKLALPHLTHADIVTLDTLVRESLEELVPPADAATGAAA